MAKKDTKKGREVYYRHLFFVGALWNWGASVVFILFYKKIFTLLGMEIPLYPSIMHLFLVLVVTFGIGYYWVSRDIQKNHDIVRMGIIGKTLVFLLFLFHSLFGNLHPLFITVGAGDLIFAVLFIEFLISSKKR